MRRAVWMSAMAAFSGVLISPASQAADFIPTAPAALQLAQVAAPTALPPVRSLNVSGNGASSVPAEQAAIILSYSVNYFSEMPVDSETPTDPSMTLEVPAIATPADLQPVTNALIAAGIPMGDISIVRESYSAQALRMVIRLNRPTQSRISELIDVANNAVIADGKFAVSTLGVAYAASNCLSAEVAAREAAMAEAQRQAIALADVAEVTLGGFITVSSNPGWNYLAPFGDSVCPTNLEDALRYGQSYGFQPYDPAQPVEVSVSVNVSLTYEIDL